MLAFYLVLNKYRRKIMGIITVIVTLIIIIVTAGFKTKFTKGFAEISG